MESTSTGVERRRRWRTEEKLRIIAESEEPGSSVTDVARRHEMNRGLLWTWRRQFRNGVLGASSLPGSGSIQDIENLPGGASAFARPLGAQGQDGRIEIALPNGTCIRVGSDVDLRMLRRVMAVLRR